MISKETDWIAARVGDQIVMMNARQGEYLGLDAMGARIWDLLDTPRSPEALRAALEAEYDVTPERCAVEVDAFIATLVQHRAVSVSA